jgi:hypothetical protein
LYNNHLLNIEIQESLFKKNGIALFLLLLGQPFLGQGLDAIFQNPGRKVGSPQRKSDGIAVKRGCNAIRNQTHFARTYTRDKGLKNI